MTWIVQPLQRKDTNGEPMGVWHLCASSDEGGGFATGCTHDHKSAEEAQGCLDARKHLGSITGFPMQMDKIKINGQEHEWPHGDQLSHEVICELAGKPVHASVTYFAKLQGDTERSGLTYAGQSINTTTGMTISCVVTGSA